MRLPFLLPALLGLTLWAPGPAAAQSAPPPRMGWHEQYQRLVYDLPGRASWTIDRQPGEVRVRLSGAALPASTFTFEVPGDSVQAVVAPQTVTLTSLQGKALRLNVTLLAPAPGAAGRRLVLDLYPADTWTEYEPPLAGPCALGQGGQSVPYVPPAFATGQVGFYMAQLDPKTLAPLKVVSHQPDALFPLASTFKQLTLWAALRDVDAGRLNLNTRLAVTTSNRSIEFYRPGNRTLLDLATQMVVSSENTASDIVQLAVGPERLQAAARGFGTCATRVQVTTKTMWAAQAGLIPEVYGPDTLSWAQTLLTLPEAAQAGAAAQAVQASLRLSPERVQSDLEAYFRSPAYSPQLDVALQNRSTPREWASLVARLHLRGGLSPQSANLFRRLLAQSCCAPKGVTYRYWGSKAGSGWRLVTLSGLLQLPGGETFAYAYFNHGSDVVDSPDIERQLPQIARYVWNTAQRLHATR
ncbi:serine hydrolase [Deinococcus aquaedulcis]|uniref:serine hydrolase n=1 Tax=Deinococcus aquaedulcis TaxID=2840455 RepID=UPI001C831B8D|nr:serine hydrolase [Deinococcus aquaedulcis]